MKWFGWFVRLVDGLISSKFGIPFLQLHKYSWSAMKTNLKIKKEFMRWDVSSNILQYLLILISSFSSFHNTEKERERRLGIRDYKSGFYEFRILQNPDFTDTKPGCFSNIVWYSIAVILKIWENLDFYQRFKRAKMDYFLYSTLFDEIK